MKKFFNDFKAATAFFRDLRRQKSETYPCIVTEYCLSDTIEGTVLFNCSRDIYKKTQDFLRRYRMRQGSLSFFLLKMDTTLTGRIFGETLLNQF